MIPNWSTTVDTPAPLLGYKPYPIALDKQALSPGPATLNQSNGRNVDFLWRVLADNGRLYMQQLVDGSWSNTVDLIAYDTNLIASLSLVFDQLGQPIIGIGKTNGQLELYWFDPEIPGYTFTMFGVGEGPCAASDNLTDTGLVDTEIRVYFIRGNEILYRRQADRFTMEYSTGITGVNLKIKNCGMRVDYRYQLHIAADEILTWPV